MIKYWSILVYIYSPLYSTFVLQSKHDTHNNIYIYSIKRKKKLDDMIIRSCAIFQAILLRGRQILNWKLSWNITIEEWSCDFKLIKVVLRHCAQRYRIVVTLTIKFVYTLLQIVGKYWSCYVQIFAGTVKQKLALFCPMLYTVNKT